MDPIEGRFFKIFKGNPASEFWIRDLWFLGHGLRMKFLRVVSQVENWKKSLFEESTIPKENQIDSVRCKLC